MCSNTRLARGDGYPRENSAPRRTRSLLHRELVGAARPLHSGEDAAGARQDRKRLLMSTIAATSGYPRAGRRLATESLRGALLWLIGFSGAFVFIEPSPYEIVGVITIFLFALTGLSLGRALAPLVLLLVLLNIGYAIAVVQVSEQSKPVIWVLVSVFLAVTAIFYAAMLGTNTQRRLDLLMRGYLAAALVAALVAIGAYFHLLGDASDMFLLYGRARGTFND